MRTLDRCDTTKCRVDDEEDLMGEYRGWSKLLSFGGLQAVAMWRTRLACQLNGDRLRYWKRLRRVALPCKQFRPETTHTLKILHNHQECRRLPTA
jgi:hypothetical protein